MSAGGMATAKAHRHESSVIFEQPGKLRASAAIY